MMLTGCSAASTPVAEAAHMWNLNVLAWGASSPALSNRERFPTFFRTHPSATLHNPTRVKLCKEWNWTKIAIIQETQEVFTSTSEDLEKEVAKANMTITARASFLTEPKTAVGNLKAQDARIIVGVFYVGFARRVFCEVYNQSFFGPNRVWFLIGWYPDNWYAEKDDNIDCTPEQLKEALEGHITTEGMMLKPDDSPSISGMTSDKFEERMAKIFANPAQTTGYPESPLAYDAVWALALALNNTMNNLAPRNLSLEDYNYNNQEIADDIYMSLNSSNFEGLSGTVAFSSTGDRLAWTQIEQMRNGTYHKIGYYSDATDNLTMVNTTEEIWPNGIPKDGVDERIEWKYISKSWYIPACLLASLTIIAAICCIIFNFLYQHTSYIKCSQCHINSITALGCVISLMCVFLLGLDGQYVSNTVFPKTCHAISWLLSIGFSLGYGSMFSKIVMMHSLVTQEKTDEDGKRKRKKVSMQNVKTWRMYITIIIILVVNLVLQLIWQIMAPMTRKVDTFFSVTVKDVRIIPQLEHCEADNLAVFLGIAYGVNGLLLIFGLFLAYETRNMSVRELNDSRLVGMAIYNVAVLGIITAPVTLIIKDQANAVFGFSSLTIIFCSAITLALIFVPKILEIQQNPRGTYNKSIRGQTTPSREDEQKHSKLAAENEEIKKQLKQREDRIRNLTELIAEHSKSLPKQANNFVQAQPCKARTNLNGPSVRLAPPAISVTEDSAYVSMAAPSTALVPQLKSVNITRATGISEDELSETYI
ncbi:gamma-aminobutyric acid type B receptor subunit 1-like isoform X2 [Apostichopus japonicus]